VQKITHGQFLEIRINKNTVAKKLMKVNKECHGVT